ncbi:MAG: hypothetical protein IKN57_03175, partial [Parasporobacterium sp.]|nr:hypothetical protein [Parasporobacterium sp.]
PVFARHAIKLTGEIGLDFYLSLPDQKTPADYPESYVTFTGNKIDQEKRYPLNKADVVSGYYEFTAFLSSIQMADKVTPVFHYTLDGREKTVTGAPYSVEDYLIWALGQGEEGLGPWLYEIARRLADYGHYAQIYLARYNNWSIGKDYAAMNTYVTREYDYNVVKKAAESGALRRTDLPPGIQSLTYRLVFGSQLQIDFRADLNEGGSISKTALLDGEPVPVVSSGKYYMISVPNIYASDLTYTWTMELDGCSVYVSPMSYIYEMIGKKSVKKDMKDLLSALYYFSLACEY